MSKNVRDQCRVRRVPARGGFVLGVARLLDFGCAFGPRVRLIPRPVQSAGQSFWQDAQVLRRDFLRIAEDFRRVIEREQPSQQ